MIYGLSVLLATVAGVTGALSVLWRSPVLLIAGMIVAGVAGALLGTDLQRTWRRLRPHGGRCDG